MLKMYVNRKYKISFAKGMQMVMEQLVLLISMVSMILKANIFSFIYLVFIYKFFSSPTKVRLLVRMNFYIAMLFFTQYLLYIFNLTSGTSPQPFPKKLINYPHIYSNEDIYKIKYAIPVFYKYECFRDLDFSYLLGIGVSRHQIESLVLDFLNLSIITMYVINFRNPLLFKSMKKVFWAFPNEYDSKEKWKRLDPAVVTQHRWLRRPYEHTHKKYEKIIEENFTK